MGGHAAWRKRVAAGGLAKGSGGASLRHRPRLGRRGAELALNRMGNLGGHGNPKKKATTSNRKRDLNVNHISLVGQSRNVLIMNAISVGLSLLVLFFILILASSGLSEVFQLAAR